MKNDCVVAILDSGIGGVSVLRSLIKKYKTGNFIYFADNMFMPYGEKNKKFINSRVKQITQMLFDKYHVSKIIIACNTASSCFKTDDKRIVEMKFNCGETYYATALTKANLKDYNVIADSSLAKQIEDNVFSSKIEGIIKNHINTHRLYCYKRLVLGCTHYELVDYLFKKHCPNTEIVNNSYLMLDEIKLESDSKNLNIVILLSKESEHYRNKIYKLIRT